MLKRCVKKGLSVRQAEELVRSLTEAAAAVRRRTTRSIPKATRGWSSCSNPASRRTSPSNAENGGGRIVIGFNDDKDIERFIEHFTKRS